VDQHPLVTTKDIIEAATNLPFLDVSRAWIPPPGEATPYTGAVTLIAMRHRAGGVEPQGVFETRRWLAAIRRGLAGRMLLGTRLVVRAPRYVGFAIRAVVEAQPARDPKATEGAIRRTLGERLALTDSANGSPPRQPGVGVTVNDLKAWIRTADGAGRVLELNLVDGDGRPISEVRVPKHGLPRWDAARSEIVVNRPVAGGGR
jgi:hypothetical protein